MMSGWYTIEICIGVGVVQCALSMSGFLQNVAIPFRIDTIWSLESGIWMQKEHRGDSLYLQKRAHSAPSVPPVALVPNFLHAPP